MSSLITWPYLTYIIHTNQALLVIFSLVTFELENSYFVLSERDNYKNFTSFFLET